jgi:hypothetical protein
LRWYLEEVVEEQVEKDSVGLEFMEAAVEVRVDIVVYQLMLQNSQTQLIR